MEFFTPSYCIHCKEFWVLDMFKSLEPQHMNVFIKELVTKIVLHGIESLPWESCKNAKQFHNPECVNAMCKTNYDCL